jgi:hypothetical protein
MTAKDKAEKLVSNFYSINYKLIKVKNGYDMGDRYNLVMPIAKECAILSIEELKTFHKDLFWINEGSLAWQYFEDVKKEIQKL